MLGWTFQPSSFFIVGLALTALVLLWRSRRYLALGQRLSARPAPVAAPDPVPAGGGEMPGHYRRWELLMHETARDLSGQLDSKMSALQALVREAHGAAARLEAALAASQQDAAVAPAPPPTTASVPAESPPAGDPRYEEIYALADYGFDSSEIAHRVGSSRGEIELILGLRKTR